VTLTTGSECQDSPYNKALTDGLWGDHVNFKTIEFPVLTTTNILALCVEVMSCSQLDKSPLSPTIHMWYSFTLQLVSFVFQLGIKKSPNVSSPMKSYWTQ